MNFQLVNLGDICHFVRGPFGGALKKEYFVESGIAVYEQQHAIYRQFTNIRYYIDEKKFKELKRFELNSGDLIMSCSGTMGKVAKVPFGIEKGIINQALLKLTPSDKINLDFLIYWMESDSFQTQLNGHTRGAAIQNVASVKVLKDLKVPLPPLAEQQKIAGILDAADSLRQKDQQLVERYTALSQALFLEVFGDPVTNPKNWVKDTLDNILSITSSKRIFEDEYVNDGVPFYRTREIVELSKGKKITLELFISDERYSEIKSKFDIPKIGDILISAVGTIGVMWVVNTASPFYFKDGNLIWMKASSAANVNPVYLKMTLDHLLEHEKFKLAEGGAYNALTIAKLKEFSVLLAPLNIQNQFAERIQLIEAQKQQAQASLDKSKALFKSLLQRAFTGELTPKLAA